MIYRRGFLSGSENALCLVFILNSLVDAVKF